MEAKAGVWLSRARATVRQVISINKYWPVLFPRYFVLRIPSPDVETVVVHAVQHPSRGESMVRVSLGVDGGW